MTTKRPGVCQTCHMPGELNRHRNCSDCQSQIAKWNTKLAADGLTTVKGRQYVKGNGVRARVAKPRSTSN